MSINCINNLFKNYDYNNIKIKRKILYHHNNSENAWIAIDNIIYSIRKDDIELLEIFKMHYGKNVKDFILNEDNFNLRDRILILDKLKERKIGYLSDS